MLVRGLVVGMIGVVFEVDAGFWLGVPWLLVMAE